MHNSLLPKFYLLFFVQAYECTATTDALGALHLPEEIAIRIKAHKTVRVLLLLDEQNILKEQQAWNSLVTTEFLRSYADSDAIYDAL